jgi:hypothetical protein
VKKIRKNAAIEHICGLLEEFFFCYAAKLQEAHPGRPIRIEAVFESGIPEFERLGYIELIDARKGTPKGIPDIFVREAKRARAPMWVLGQNWPGRIFDIFDQMKVSLGDDRVLWEHSPPERPNVPSPRARVSEDKTG